MSWTSFIFNQLKYTIIHTLNQLLESAHSNALPGPKNTDFQLVDRLILLVFFVHHPDQNAPINFRLDSYLASMPATLTWRCYSLVISPLLYDSYALRHCSVETCSSNEVFSSAASPNILALYLPLNKPSL